MLILPRVPLRCNLLRQAHISNPGRTPFHLLHTSSGRRPYNILFFGSDEFSIICLENNVSLVANPGSLISHLEVVTPPDNPRNKVPQGSERYCNPVPLKQYAETHRLPVHAAPRKTLKGWEPQTASSDDKFDLAVVVSFGYFLPRTVISSFKSGAFNVHPSLLPQYRGAAPLQHTILNGDTETGVSIIELDDKRFDVGRILKQTHVSVPPNIFLKDLHDQLGEIGANDMLDVIRNLEAARMEARTQSDQHATHAPKISKEMALVDWNNTGESIYRLHRAIGYKLPLFTTFRKKRMQILEMDDPSAASLPNNLISGAAPGTTAFSENLSTMYVKCVDTWLACKKLKVEGKRELSIKDFEKGYQLKNLKKPEILGSA
ncbi:formyl transferase [Gaertneriomyces semiglobifer]|nr:formyl transferase [Gaertneriomyces semiglobifer]